MSADHLSETMIDWRLSLQAKGRSEATVRDYLRSGEAFAAWLSAEGHSTDVTEISRRVIRTYLASLDGRAPATVAKYYRNLQQLFKSLTAEEIIEKNPFKGIDPPHVPEQPVAVVADADIKRLLAHCAGSDFESRRDAAMIRMMLDTGMRSSELIGIQIGQIDFGTLSVPIIGKGNRGRIAVFGSKTAEALRRYERSRRAHPEKDTQDYWIGAKGKLTDSGLRQMLERHSRRAGVDHVHPHRFRHTMAHQWMRDGQSEGDLMRLAGWRSR